MEFIFMKIKTELAYEYRDAGPWRSYSMETEGHHHHDLIDNCTIAEIDQDGGELDCYGIWDAPYKVTREALSIIEDSINDYNEMHPGDKDMQIKLERIL